MIHDPRINQICTTMVPTNERKYIKLPTLLSIYAFVATIILYVDRKI
jgi:hypothetical protein